MLTGRGNSGFRDSTAQRLDQDMAAAWFGGCGDLIRSDGQLLGKEVHD